MTKIRAGIVGCGSIYPMHAYSINSLDFVELVAVCDKNYDKAASAANNFGCKAYTDFNEFIKDAKLDAVHICTPHYLHHTMAIEALKSSIHVLTEKPMSIHYQDAVAMVKEAKKNNKILAVNFQNRYNNSSRLIKKTLEDGQLGNVLSAKLYVTWNRSDSYYATSDWKGTWEKEGGGVLINQAIHTFDLVCWFIDSEVKSVDAYITNRFHKEIEVEDCAEGIIQFDNGAIASFHAINYYGYDAPVYIELYCENGIAAMSADTAKITFTDGRMLETSSDDDNDAINYGSYAKEYWGNTHHKLIHQFYDAIVSGGPLDVDAEHLLKTQKLICDIYKSGLEKWDKIKK